MMLSLGNLLRHISQITSGQLLKKFMKIRNNVYSLIAGYRAEYMFVRSGLLIVIQIMYKSFIFLLTFGLHDLLKAEVY